MLALTVAVVTKPFEFEGKRRLRQAEKGLAELRGSVDTIITIPNDRLELIDDNIEFTESFRKADEVLLQAVQGISDLITTSGIINLDFADVRAVIHLGVARARDRAVLTVAENSPSGTRVTITVPYVAQAGDDATMPA